MNQITRIAAYGVLQQDNDLLLCRHRESQRWTMPGGGIEFGESPEEAMVREVKEETGLDVRPTGLLGINSFAIYRDFEQFHSIQVVYSAEFLGGELLFELEGTTDMCAWHPIDTAHELDVVELVSFSLEKIYSAMPSV